MKKKAWKVAFKAEQIMFQRAAEQSAAFKWSCEAKEELITKLKDELALLVAADADMRREQLRFYHSDGSFEELASPEEVIQKRIDCAVIIETHNDLLRSAYAIAERKGKGTNWARFSAQLHKAGISPITPRTFRVLPDDGDGV